MKKQSCKYIKGYIYSVDSLINARCISNFWSIMKAMHPKMQRKLLMFVTGSDRIPATGATQMHLKITCGNNGDSDR
jgi:E3 ubiquitin-protein ligase HECTD2